MKTLRLKIAIGLAFVLIISTTALIAQTTFKFGGYVKTDYIFTRFYNGPNSGVLGRDFHVPSAIPVGEKKIYDYTDFHAKESRFNFDVTSKINDKPIRAFVELDFMLSGQGDQRVSNSYSPRLRHFFFEYQGFLFGQTWSTFMIVQSLPEDLDFIKATEGVVFIRQPQLRYTLKGENGSWQFALENPLSTVTPTLESGGRSSYSGVLPDAVVKKNFETNRVSISIAGLGRKIVFLKDDGSKASTYGYGLTAGGKIKIGKRDDIRLSATAGKGVGRYVALNFINAAIYDTATSKISSIGSINGNVAYLLHYTDKLMSSFNASAFIGEIDGSIPNAKSNRLAQSYSANLMYKPSPKLLFGIEYMYATRELQNGTKGAFSRIQLAAKYTFDYSHTSVPQEKL